MRVVLISRVRNIINNVGERVLAFQQSVSLLVHCCMMNKEIRIDAVVRLHARCVVSVQGLDLGPTLLTLPASLGVVDDVLHELRIGHRILNRSHPLLHLRVCGVTTIS